MNLLSSPSIKLPFGIHYSWLIVFALSIVQIFGTSISSESHYNGLKIDDIEMTNLDNDFDYSLDSSPGSFSKIPQATKHRFIKVRTVDL